MGLISVPQSPIFQGAHLCASVPILQGLISASAPHYLRASLCSQPPGYTASLLSSGRCPLLSLCLQPPQGPLSPSPFQVSGGSLPALPIFCLLPPFLVAHLFTVGCSRGAASPAGLLATNGGTRLQQCRMLPQPREGSPRSLTDTFTAEKGLDVECLSLEQVRAEDAVWWCLSPTSWAEGSWAWSLPCRCSVLPVLHPFLCCQPAAP